MVLFFATVTLLEGNPSPAAWIQRKVTENDVSWLIGHFEPVGANYPLADLEDRPRILDWFAQLEIMLDGYNWLFSQRLFSPQSIVAHPKSCLWQATRYLVEHILCLNASESTTMTPLEISTYNSKKCTMIVRLLQLFHTLLSHDGKAVPQDLWSDNFLQFILVCSLDPGSYGFDLTDAEVMRNLPSLTGSILLALTSKLPAALKAVLEQEVQAMLSMSIYDICNEAELIKDPSLSTAGLPALISGYEQLFAANLLAKALADNRLSIARVADKLVQILLERCTNAILSPKHEAVAARLMDLALTLHIPSAFLMQCFLDSERLVTRTDAGHADDDDEMESAKQLRATRGSVFFRAHATQLSSFVARHFSVFAKPLFSEIANPTIALIVGEVLDAMQTTASLKKYSEEFAAAFFVNARLLSKWWEPATRSPQTHLDAVLLFQRVMALGISHRYSFELSEFRPLFEMYIAFLRDPAITLPNKGLQCDSLV